jgi:hypothetical protein
MQHVSSTPKAAQEETKARSLQEWQKDCPKTVRETLEHQNPNHKVVAHLLDKIMLLGGMQRGDDPHLGYLFTHG